MKRCFFNRIIGICVSLILSYLGYGIITYRNDNYLKIMFDGKYTFIDYSSVIIIAFLLYLILSFKIDNVFYENVKNVFKDLQNFVSDALLQLYDKRILIGSIILFLAIYGYQISNFTLSLDEEFQMSQAKNIVQWCYEGRFSIGILKNFFMAFGMYEPYLSNLIASLIMLLNALLFCCLLDNIKYKNKAHYFSKLVFIAFYMSFPSIVVEFMSFSTYCIEVAFGMTILLCSVWLFHRYLENKEKSFIIFNIFLVFFALGIYQAMATVYITLISIYFFVKIYEKKRIEKKEFVRIAKDIFLSFSVFLISVIVFFIVYKIATSMHYVQGSIDYINDFSGWDFKQGIITSLKNSIATLFETVFHTDIIGLVYFRWYILTFIVDALLVLFFNRSKSILEKILLIILLSEILLSGFYMWIVLASTALPLRAWLAVLFVAGFMYYLLAEILIDKFPKTFILLGGFAIMIIGIRQIQTINELFVNDHKRMEKDFAFAEEIYENIASKVTDIENKTIVFIGTRDLANDITIIKNPTTDLYFGGDALGYSLWRRAQEPHRMKGLFAYLGYDLEFQACTQEEYELAKNTMEIFPLDNSILESNNIVYVRLE